MGSRARTKSNHLGVVRNLYLQHPQGLTDIEVAEMLRIDRRTAQRYRKDLGAVAKERGRYTVIPSRDDVQNAVAVLRRAGVLDDETIQRLIPSYDT